MYPDCYLERTMELFGVQQIRSLVYSLGKSIVYNTCMPKRHDYRRRNRPHRPYRGRKRQADSEELFMTLGIVFIVLCGVVVYKASTQSFAMIIAGLIVAALAVLVVVIFVAANKTRKLRAIQLSGVDKMDGLVFEKYVAELLKSQGYHQVRITEQYDLGIDILAEKDGAKWGIQVKRNRGKTKAESVRAVVTALNHYKCDRSMVISNSVFTNPAKKLAYTNNCVLIDRSILGNWILAFQSKR